MLALIGILSTVSQDRLNQIMCLTFSLCMRQDNLLSFLFKVLQAFCQPRCLQLWSAVYLAYPTPYSETLLENGDTSDYGDSVSSACITPVSPVFPSVNNGIDQDEGVTQTCRVTASKSDGNLMCKDCLKNQQELDHNGKQFNSLDRNLKSRSCPECRTAFTENNIQESASTAKDIVNDTAAFESKSLYNQCTVRLLCGKCSVVRRQC